MGESKDQFPTRITKQILEFAEKSPTTEKLQQEIRSRENFLEMQKQLTRHIDELEIFIQRPSQPTCGRGRSWSSYDSMQIHFATEAALQANATASQRMYQLVANLWPARK